MGARFQKVKGTRDFYPQEKAISNWIVDRWRAVSIRNSFAEYDGPTFEYLDLYKAKSGEGIVSELFHFEDRGGRQLALRPEMTPTLARMVAAQANSLSKPIKWFCVPNFFRAERPQRGRLREFLQWNVDIIGSPPQANPLADAECIFTALDFFAEVGLTPEHVEMRISSRVVLAEVLISIGIAPTRHDAIYALLDKRDKLPEKEFIDQLQQLDLDARQIESLVALGRCRGESGLAQIEEMLQSESASASLRSLQETFELLRALKLADYCVFDLGVVRGLAYYTGIVFEAYSKGTLQRAMCGGGRYDNLLEAVGGPKLSGVGFGMGDVIVLDQLSEAGILPSAEDRMSFFVVYPEPSDVHHALSLVSTIRREFKEPCGFSYKCVSLRKQLQQAQEAGAEIVVFAQRPLQVKIMATGQQLELKEEVQLTHESFLGLIGKGAVSGQDDEA